MVKIIIVLLLLAIVASLASALFSLLTQKDRGGRMLKMLTVRIALSIVAFVVLMAGFALGLIEPRGGVPAPSVQIQ